MSRRFESRRQELLAKRVERQQRARCRALSRFSARNGRDPRQGVDRRADSGRPAGPPRRDHRPGRPQDDHQRAQLAAPTSSWPTSRTPTRRPGPTTSKGQINLRDAVRRTIDFTSPEGKQYQLDEKTATLLVRPRGWHLVEKHLLRRRQADLGFAVRFRAVFLPQRRRRCSQTAAGLTSICRSWRAISRRGCGTTCFVFAQDEVGVPQGSIRAHRADRDDPGGVRDGRDSLRAARPLRRA